MIASDNILVADVYIKILDREGNVLEQGLATQPDLIHDPERWEYACSAEGTIEATAWDLAYNQTTVKLVKTN